MKIKQIFFFATGNYVAFDEKDAQIPDEGGNAWMNIIQDKLNRGLITKSTKLSMSGWEGGDGMENWTVADLIKSGRVKEKA
jgi:hypothetical protein